MRASLSMQSLRSVVVGLLVAQMVVPAAVVAQAQEQSMSQETMQPAPALSIRTPANAGMKLEGDQKILQVLNRFTYGPRPGDLERVRAIGINAWFQQQLNPDSIDDSALDKRLESYPAMQMPLNKLMSLYPTNTMIKQAMNGRGGTPGGDAARAIYADSMERYKDKKKKKGTDGEMDDDAAPLPQSADDILAMPPDKRFKALCRLTLPQLKELRKSLTADQREHLTDGMTPQQTEELAAFNGPRGVVQAEDVQVKLLRDIYSERQLKEVMVDFWLNHFNVYIAEIAASALLH